MDDKITVIIPCYNQGDFLKESVGSVLAQTYTNWECIIVDDGSSDNTKEIAVNYAQSDTRIQYVYKSNGGLSSARNKGLENAKGKWIQFLDADDALYPEKFSRQLQAVTVNKQIKRILIYSDYAFGTPDHIFENMKRTIPVQFSSDNYLQELITRWETDLIIPCHCFLLSSDFFLKDGIRFDETLPNHEDFDCWLSIFSKNPEVLFVDEILCRYRLSNHSMSTNMRLMGEGFLQVLERHFKMTYPSQIKSLLVDKRLSVLQTYKRFDLMTLKDKLNSLRVLKKYYSQRITDKIGI